MILDSREQIDQALKAGSRTLVVGLNGRGDIQLQLPDGANYAQFTADQAEELAELLLKWAKAWRVNHSSERGPT